MADEIEALNNRIEALEKEVFALQKELQLYKKSGGGRLYYALIRKQNEMADLLNESTLRASIVESDKSFERLRYLWNDAKDLVINTKILGEAMGVTGNEERDISRLTTFLDKNAT